MDRNASEEVGAGSPEHSDTVFIARREHSPSPLAYLAGAPPGVYDSGLRQEPDISPIVLARVVGDPSHAGSEPSLELETLEEPLLNYPLRNEAR